MFGEESHTLTISPCFFEYLTRRTERRFNTGWTETLLELLGRQQRHRAQDEPGARDIAMDRPDIRENISKLVEFLRGEVMGLTVDGVKLESGTHSSPSSMSKLTSWRAQWTAAANYPPQILALAQQLFRRALTTNRRSAQYFSFCTASWVEVDAMWHCEACRTCRRGDQSHCRACGTCVLIVNDKCVQCRDAAKEASRLGYVVEQEGGQKS